MGALDRVVDDAELAALAPAAEDARTRAGLAAGPGSPTTTPLARGVVERELARMSRCHFRCDKGYVLSVKTQRRDPSGGFPGDPEAHQQRTRSPGAAAQSPTHLFDHAARAPTTQAVPVSIRCDPLEERRVLDSGYPRPMRREMITFMISFVPA